MGTPSNLRRVSVTVGAEAVDLVTLNMGNPQAIILGPLPDDDRFQSLGSALERHQLFPEGTNVEFVHVEASDSGPASESGNAVSVPPRRPAPGHARRWWRRPRLAVRRETPRSSRPAGRSASNGVKTRST